ncbi:MAG: Heme exporter protein C [Anaerolineae bacterium]|nr:Heme exporter protein C [Anaerolineae bacterium]RIK29441.1 MAG: cytochrome C assembly protein [Chloroflexota bacterium]
MNTKRNWSDIWGIVTLIAVMVGLYFAFVYAPTEATMGSIQRIFYFHMGSNAASLTSILIAAIAAALFLRSGNLKYDRVSYACMELGVLFGAISLATGMIWARPVWGTWWTWEARLTSFLILWLVYVAYMMLRLSSANDPTIARIAAVFTFVGVIDVPFIMIAPRLWRGLHPVLFGTNAGGEFTFNITPEMLTTLFVCIVAVMCLYIWLLVQRAHLGSLQAQVAELREQYGE